MTNKEILHANLLDIIFDNRNKEYGAYTLRRGYNHRLLIALGAGLSVILFFVLVSMWGKKEEIMNKTTTENGGVIIKSFELPEEKKKKSEIPIVKPKPVQQKTIEQIAKIDFPPIRIVPDDKANKTVASQEDLDGNQIATENTSGNNGDDIVKIDNPALTSGISNEAVKPTSDFIPKSSDPEYPGGQEALMRFLSKNLNTPDEMQAGEKKMVKIRFKVDDDGLVTAFIIEQSAGGMFDKEVIRVCKKMPRWKPAIQNGVPVPVSYVLPVTFIGVEQ